MSAVHIDATPVQEGPAVASVSVEHLMDITIQFQPMQILRTPVTTRLIAVVADGTFEGPRLRGKVLPGGGDWLVLGEDNIARLDVRATFQTDDGEYLYLTNTGRVALRGQEAVARYLAGETLYAENMRARTVPLFETGAKKYAWLNETVNIGLVDLSLNHIAYRVYSIS